MASQFAPSVAALSFTGLQRIKHKAGGLGLVSKRRDLAGEAKLLEDQAKVIRTDLATLDAAIKVLDPSFDLRAPERA